jgi:hypothetical protein
MTETKKPRKPRVSSKAPKSPIETLELKPLATLAVPKFDPLKDDFRNFLYVVWMHLGLPKPTKAQYRMAYYLQFGANKSILAAFRGIGKSYITVAYAAWRLLKDPQVKIMVVSAGEDRATAFSVFLKSILEGMPELNHLKTRLGQRDSVLNFDVGPSTPSGSPSVKSVGISGQLTGSRADIIIADDIEIPRNSQTHDQREKLSALVKEFAAVITPGGKILYLGTPQTELSLYNILEERGYNMRIYPARYPNAAQIASYGSKLDPNIIDDLDLDAAEGQPTDPERFSEEDLIERELEYGRSGFALQFMLDTSLSDGVRMPLRIDDLIVMPCRAETVPNIVRWSNNPLLKITNLPNVALAGQGYYANEMISEVSSSPFKASVMTIDPSGRGGDETGYAVLKWSEGNFYLPAFGGMAGGYSDETLIGLCEIAKKYKVNTILIESNFGDSMYSQLLKPHLHRIYPCMMEEVRHSSQKELRIIESLEPIMNQHRLIVDPSAIQEDYESAMKSYPADKARDYMALYQLSRVTKDRGSLRHDDRLEAIAMGITHFINLMSVDQDTMAKKRAEEMFDARLIRKANRGGQQLPENTLNCHKRWDAKLKAN